MDNIEQSTQDAINMAVELVTTYGLSVVGGLAIFIFGWIAASWMSGGVRRALSRSRRVDATLRGFFASLVKYAVLAFVIIAVLNQFGVQTASLIAIFGAASLAIGLALQGTLSNVAAGVMLLIFRPLKVGQYVEVAGHAGTVQEITLFTTELATPDNVQIVIPNAQVWGSAVVNYSAHKLRRCDFTLSIAYSDDVDAAIAVVHREIGNDSRALSDPEPTVAVAALAESSVDLTARIWVNAEDYWPFKFDMTKRFKQAFDAAGLTIPFPQREIKVQQEISAPRAAE
jgi:small conductance mechanosensitive channel